KAGALFRTKKEKEAAYYFSQAFSNTKVKRISNYLGFKWSINSIKNKDEYLSMCKSDKEKATMLAMFIIGSPENELETIKEIYQLDPSNEALELLIVREINKLEEKYLTPSLQKEKGGKTFY